MRLIDRRTAGFLFALALVLGASACIDDPTTLSEDGIPLSEEDAAFLGLEAWRASVVARQEANVEEPDAASPAPALAIIQRSREASVTRSCEHGGSRQATIDASLTYDDVADTGVLEVELELTHTDCSVDRNGTRYTLNGWPSVEASIDAARLEGGEKTLDATLVGALRVTRGDATGICSLDLSITGTEAPNGFGTYSISGTVCGAPIETNTTIAAET